jgi:hypothetical protein
LSEGFGVFRPMLPGALALVAEDGREWYGVRYCDDPGWWVK